MNLNRAIIAGNVTQDPVMRKTSSGQSVVTLTVATNRTWTGKDGGRQESAEFHNVVLWGRLAEIVEQYVQKGRLILVEGRIQTRSYEDAGGQKKYRTEIVAENMQMGPRGGASQGAPPSKEPGESREEIPIVEDGEVDAKDIPF